MKGKEIDEQFSLTYLRSAAHIHIYVLTIQPIIHFQSFLPYLVWLLKVKKSMANAYDSHHSSVHQRQKRKEKEGFSFSFWWAYARCAINLMHSV